METTVTKAMALAGACMAVATCAADVRAQQPSQQRQFYGPATICLGGYSVSVNAAEAVEVRIEGNQQPVSAVIHRIDRPDIWIGQDIAQDAKTRLKTIQRGSLTKVIRFDVPRITGYRAGIPGEVVYFDDPAHHYYVLPGIGGDQAFQITSDAFYSRGDDGDELVHFAPRTKVTSCLDFSKSQASLDDTRVQLLSPLTYSAPDAICLGGLSLQLDVGEVAQRGWTNDSTWQIRTESAQVSLLSLVPYRKGNPSGSFKALGFKISAEQPGYLTYVPPANFPRKGGDSIFVAASFAPANRTYAKSLMDRMRVRNWRDKSCISAGSTHAQASRISS